MQPRTATTAALIGYLLLLIGLGIWSRRRTRGFSDYVTGGGAIPAWMLALSFMANFISSNSFVGHAAQSYKVGLIWCVVGAMMVVCCAISWHVLAPRFAAFARARGAETLPDFFEKRFESRGLAILVNWVVLVATLFYILAVLRGTALVVASGLGLSYVQALFVIYAVTVIYCWLGGLWADVSTDVIQAVLLVIGAIALFVAVASAAPVPTVHPPPIQPVPLGLVLAVGLGGSLKLMADPKQVMVFYAFRDAAAARRFRWVGPILLLVVYACLFPLGFLARDLIGNVSDLEALIPRLVFERGMLGSWFGVVFLIALLAASMSSLDSAFLVMASCIEKHALAPLLHQPPRIERTRWILLGVATLTLLLSIRPLGSIIVLTTFAGALLGASLLPGICVGLSQRVVSARAVGISVVAGVLGTLLGKAIPEWMGVTSPWIQDVFVGLAASSLILLPTLVRSPPRVVTEAS